jgi:hypothetical protein
MGSLTDIRQRHHQGKQWRCAQDIGDLLGLLDEALELLDAVANSADDGAWHSSDDCQVEGRADCELCADVTRAREFVGRLRGTE